MEYDDVMNIQREKFYRQRRRVLEGNNLSENINYMIQREVERVVGSFLSEGMDRLEYQEADLKLMLREFYNLINIEDKPLQVEQILDLDYNEILEKLQNIAYEAYKTHEKRTIDFYNDVIEQYNAQGDKQEAFSSDNVMRNIEKDILLRIVDNKWIDHLHNIDMLREGIGLRAYGQKDPLIEYKKEAYDLFNKMMAEIQSETVRHLFRTKFGVQIIEKANESPIETELTEALKSVKTAEKLDSSLSSQTQSIQKVGRNDPCPCGSGKKYKHCCGK